MARAALSLTSRISPLAYPGGIAPGFDPNHVAAKGALFSAIPMAGNFVSLGVGNVRGGLVGTIAGSPTTVFDGIIGPTMSFPGSGDLVQFSFPNLQFSPMTLAGIFRINTNLATNQNILGTFGGTGQSIGWATTGFFLNGNSNSAVAAFPVTAAAIGVPFFVAVSSSSGGTANWVALNLQTGSIRTASVVSGTWSAQAQFNIGNRGTPSKQAAASIAAAMMNNQFMSLPQLLQWSVDPWAFWYPPTFDINNMLSPTIAAAFRPYWAQQTNIPVLGTGTY